MGLPLGVGAWAWGDRGYWGYGKDYGREDVDAAYAASREVGLTLVDTAELYGRGASERIVGQLVRADWVSDQVVVATKFAPFPWRAGRRGTLTAALESSLGRLRRDHVELYQIHWSLPLISDRPWLQDLAEAYRDGLIGAVGVSNYNAHDLLAAHRVLADLGVPLVTNQVEYSLLSRKPETSGLAAACAEVDVTIIAWSPLSQGMLTGKYGPGRAPSGVRALRYRRILDRLPMVVDQLTEIGQAHGGRSAAQVALNWLVAKGAVPIPGAKTAEQAAHNAAGVVIDGQVWSLSPDEVTALDALRV